MKKKERTELEKGLLFQGLSARFPRNPDTYCAEILLAVRHLATLKKYNPFCPLLFYFSSNFAASFFYITNFKKPFCNSFRFIVLQQYVIFEAILAIMFYDNVLQSFIVQNLIRDRYSFAPPTRLGVDI